MSNRTCESCKRESQRPIPFVYAKYPFRECPKCENSRGEEVKRSCRNCIFMVRKVMDAPCRECIKTVERVEGNNVWR